MGNVDSRLRGNDKKCGNGKNIVMRTYNSDLR